ncbi:MAG: aminotransferase class V-fold PLP-dependent enzyme [Leadbetterella sp.]
MNRDQIYFTAGPAELYPKFEEFLQEFVEKQLGSISHRSGQFKEIYEFTDHQLRTLLNIPAENAVMFTGSASEIWEKALSSLVSHESFHLVNGSFSDKFHSYAVALGKEAKKMEKPLGDGFIYGEIEVPQYAELICATQNETSTGVQMREADIHKLKRSNQDKLIAVDMVSSAPYPNLDFGVVDTAFFSVQKSFGLPAGLGVWIANEACLDKAKKNKADGGVLGAHHDLLSLWKNAKAYQNPATPNVMGIYLLGKVAEDMNSVGIDNIRKQTDKKAKRLYDFFGKKEGYSYAVANEDLRSKTVAVFNTPSNSKEVISKCKEANIIIGAGYGPNKDSQIRISNFAANSDAQIDKLFETLT